MTTRYDPLWHLRLARDDAAAAAREAVEYMHAVEAGQVTEPGVVFSRKRRQRARRRDALAAWIGAGYASLWAS